MASKAQRIDSAEVIRLEVRGSGSRTSMSSRVSEALEVPLFAALPPADRNEIISAAREKVFLPGETIFLEGEPVRQMLLLTSGHVKMTQLSQNGLEVILRVCGRGETIEVFPQN